VELKRNKKLLLFIILGLLISCRKKINFKYVKENMWQYNKGIKIGEGDFIEFDDPQFFELHYDTIYYRGKAKAVITDANEVDNELILKDLDTGFNGYYINVVEFTK